MWTRNVYAISRNSICRYRLIQQPLARMCTSEMDAETRAKIVEARRLAAERHAQRLKEREEAKHEEKHEENEPAAEKATASATAAKEPTPKKVPFSFAKEIEHIKEFAAKFRGPQRERRRIAEDIKVTKEKWASGELAKRKKAADTTTQPIAEDVDFESMSPEERAAYEAKIEKEQEELAQLNSTPLMHVGTTETVWEQRFSAMKDRLRRTWPASNWRTLRRKAAMSDNPVIQQARDLKEDMADNVQEIGRAHV